MTTGTVRMHSKVLAARQKRNDVYADIAHQLVIKVRDSDSPMTLIERVSANVAEHKEMVAAVYWELVRRGVFNLDASLRAKLR